jgi:hypothetical protein
MGNEKLYVCNRGEGTTNHAIEVYPCPKDSVTEQIVQKIRNTFSTLEEFQEFLRNPPIGSPLMGASFDMALQKTGNCSWANTKGIFLALLNIVMERTHPDVNVNERHEICHRIYKRFSSSHRKSSSERYLSQNTSDISLEVLLKMREKLDSYESLTVADKDALREKINAKVVVLKKEIQFSNMLIFNNLKL